jgi:hypothetical protein
MKFHLVVVRPFATYSRGDIIADAARISEILRGEHAHAVVRVANSATAGA